MKLVIVAIRDRAVDAFMRPFYVRSTGEALRVFADTVNSKDSPMNGHPEDYDMYVLGTFTEETGLFDTGIPSMIGIGKDTFVKI